MIVHGFAGIGWSEALPPGHSEIGFELNTAACRTRRAAGHPTVQCDVTRYPTWPFKGRTLGKIDSPPCPGFNKSGKKLGLLDLPLVHQAIEDLSRGKDTRAAAARCCRPCRRRRRDPRHRRTGRRLTRPHPPRGPAVTTAARPDADPLTTATTLVASSQLAAPSALQPMQPSLWSL